MKKERSKKDPKLYATLNLDPFCFIHDVGGTLEWELFRTRKQQVSDGLNRRPMWGISIVSKQEPWDSLWGHIATV